MSCEIIEMPDGTRLIVDLVEGAVLTAEDKEAIAEWVQFVRDRNAKKKTNPDAGVKGANVLFEKGAPYRRKCRPR